MNRPNLEQEPPKAPAPRFAKWIEDTGADAIAESLGVDRTTVYAWRRWALGLSNPRRPDPSKLGPILRLASGKLIAADVYPG